MIETHSKISLYAQYAASIREKIERGEIKPGDRLPSILNAAEEAALSPGTIKQAYKVLTEEVYVTIIQGRGTIVLDTKRAAQQREPSGTLVTSNQARAEKAIDRLFQDLGRMGFSFSDTEQERSVYFENIRPALGCSDPGLDPHLGANPQRSPFSRRARSP